MATKPNQSTPPPASALDGLLSCGHCHLPMSATNTDGISNMPRYACPTTMDGSKSNCPTPPVPARNLDRTILKRITEHLTADHSAPQLIAVVKEQSSNRLSQATMELEHDQNSLTHLSAERQRLLRQVEEEQFTYQEISHLAEASATAAEKLTAQVTATMERIAAHERAATDDYRTIERANDTEALIRNGQVSARIQLFQALLEEVTLDQTKIRISYKIPILVHGHSLPDNTEEITLQKGLPH